MELERIDSYSAMEVHSGSGDQSDEAEMALLKATSREIRSHADPLLVTCSGDAFAPFLRHRGTSIGEPVEWLPDSQHACRFPWETARHLDLCQSLWGVVFYRSSRHPIWDGGVMALTDPRDLQCLETLAVSAFAMGTLVLRSLGRCEVRQYEPAMGALMGRVATLAEERPHLWSWLHDFPGHLDSEQQR